MGRADPTGAEYGAGATMDDPIVASIRLHLRRGPCDVAVLALALSKEHHMSHATVTTIIDGLIGTGDLVRCGPGDRVMLPEELAAEEAPPTRPKRRVEVEGATIGLVLRDDEGGEEIDVHLDPEGVKFEGAPTLPPCALATIASKMLQMHRVLFGDDHADSP